MPCGSELGSDDFMFVSPTLLLMDFPVAFGCDIISGQLRSASVMKKSVLILIKTLGKLSYTTETIKIDQVCIQNKLLVLL